MKKILFLNLMLLLSAVSLHAQIAYGSIETKTDTAIFSYVEIMPEPAFDIIKYLDKNMKYPKEAVENNIQGRVTVGFVVNTDGSLSNPEIKSEKIAGGESLEEEAIRLIKNMPKWKPGKQNGKPVRVYYTQPLTWMLH